jgi:hypothetical protein
VCSLIPNKNKDLPDDFPAGLFHLSNTFVIPHNSRAGADWIVVILKIKVKLESEYTVFVLLTVFKTFLFSFLQACPASLTGFFFYV